MSEQIIQVGESEITTNRIQQDQLLDKRQQQIEKMYKPHAIEFAPLIFLLVTGTVIYWGAQAELENYIRPNSGLGYALGISGGVMMLLLLLYPLRKRAKWMREWGQIRYWFSTHMMLGIIGPMVILFHCNFRLGSQNSNIALFSMLLVMASGIVGRYLYSRIHFGLYGNEITLRQLHQDEQIAQYELSRLFDISPQLHEQIKKYNDVLEQQSRGLISSFFKICLIGIKSRLSQRLARRLLLKYCQQVAEIDGWPLSRVNSTLANGNLYLKIHYATIRRLVGFAFFERLFSFWHLLHMPFFIMLILTAIAHVVAVHVF